MRVREITKSDGSLNWDALSEDEKKFWDQVGEMGRKFKLDADFFITWCLRPHRKCGWVPPIEFFNQPMLFCKLTADLMKKQKIQISEEDMNEITREPNTEAAGEAAEVRN